MGTVTEGRPLLYDRPHPFGSGSFKLLLDAAHYVSPMKQVQVVNVNNVPDWKPYTIPHPRGNTKSSV